MYTVESLRGLCRICLQDGAVVPIFEDEDVKNVSSKLELCLQKPIKDIDGYPRFICKECNNNLDKIYQFINKYYENSKILENTILSAIKSEAQEIFNENECEDTIEPEIHSEDVKKEVDVFLEEPVDFVDCSELIITEKTKSSKTHRKRKLIPKNKNNVITNNIASSILEGVYAWTGERWCLSSTIKEEPVPEKIKGRKPKLKLKVKKTKAKHDKLCDLCGEVYRDADKLRMHKIKAHTAKAKFTCSVDNCNKVCNSNYNLRRHVVRKHSEKKNFMCNDCGITFAFKSEMKCHMKSHDRVTYPKKNFSCQYCDKTYRCQKSVDIHERSAHTGYRPAQCSVCDAAFFHEDYLKQHMMLHTGETPFKCPVCDRGYAQRGNMKSHLRNHRLADLDADTLKNINSSYYKYFKL